MQDIDSASRAIRVGVWTVTVVSGVVTATTGGRTFTTTLPLFPLGWRDRGRVCAEVPPDALLQVAAALATR